MTSAESPLAEHPEGALLTVHAHAGARRNHLQRSPHGGLRVWVTQAPEKGKANKAIIALLADELGLRKSQIELIAGQSSSQKRFLIRGVKAAELGAKLSAFDRP